MTRDITSSSSHRRPSHPLSCTSFSTSVSAKSRCTQRIVAHEFVLALYTIFPSFATTSFFPFIHRHLKTDCNCTNEGIENLEPQSGVCQDACSVPRAPQHVSSLISSRLLTIEHDQLMSSFSSAPNMLRSSGRLCSSALRPSYEYSH